MILLMIVQQMCLSLAQIKQGEGSEIQTAETLGITNGIESQTAEICQKQSSLSPDNLKAPSASLNKSPASDQ